MRRCRSIKLIAAVLVTMVVVTVATAEDIKLNNGKVELTFSTAYGRIMSFHQIGQPNVLWNNDNNLRLPYLRGYPNHGGDKVWLVSQKSRSKLYGKRLPDPYIDGKAWTVVEKSKRSVTVQSVESPVLEIVVQRKITLDAQKPVVVIENRLTCNKQLSVPVYIWQVSQVRRPEFFFMGLCKVAPPEKAYSRYRNNKSKSKISNQGDALKIVLPADGWDKINAWGNWLAAVVGNQLFVQIGSYDSTEKYADNSTAQVYCNEYYIEMETLSPCRSVVPGTTLRNRIVWGLLTRGPGNEIKQIKDFVSENGITK